VKRLLRLRIHKRVLVSLKSGESFAGVLYDADSEAFVLRNAEALGVAERGAPLPVDGEVVILRADVAFVQVP